MVTRELLEKYLPDHSGFTVRHIEEKKDKFVIYMDYHVMNDQGYYVGYIDFSLHIPKGNPEDFKLRVHGRRSHYLVRHYDMRWVLEEALSYDIRDMIEEIKTREKEDVA